MKKGEVFEFIATQEEGQKLDAIIEAAQHICKTESPEFQMVCAMTFTNRCVNSPEMHINACVNSIANCLNDYMENDRDILKQCLEGLMKAVDRNING